MGSKNPRGLPKRNERRCLRTPPLLPRRPGAAPSACRAAPLGLSTKGGGTRCRGSGYIVWACEHELPTSLGTNFQIFPIENARGDRALPADRLGLPVWARWPGQSSGLRLPATAVPHGTPLSALERPPRAARGTCAVVRTPGPPAPLSVYCRGPSRNVRRTECPARGRGGRVCGSASRGVPERGPRSPSLRPRAGTCGGS